jgi:hypothetical protein
VTSRPHRTPDPDGIAWFVVALLAMLIVAIVVGLAIV